jgi:methylmalonyl-CoA carboxyltransferase large subunit
MSTEGVDGSADRPASADPLADQIMRLTERVAALEAAIRRDAGSPATASVPTGSPVAASEANRSGDEAAELSEEVVLVLSAAIAAYLGKQAHLRQARLVGASGWAREGRITIQASHQPAKGARQGATT